MCSLGSLAPDAVGLGADDGLSGGDAFGEVRARPGGCRYDEVEASFRVGSEDIVGSALWTPVMLLGPVVGEGPTALSTTRMP